MYELRLEAPLRIHHKSEGGPWGEGIIHDHDLVVALEVAYEYAPGGPSPVPFTHLHDLLDRELDAYRSTVLNRLPDFRGTCVLFEDLARVIHDRLVAEGLPIGLTLASVEVFDTRSAVRITYRPNADGAR